MFSVWRPGAEIRRGAYAVHTEHIEVWDNVIIRPGSHFYADDQSFITIWQDVLLGPGVHIYTNNHNIQGGPDAYHHADVVIEQGAWIGANAILLAGTHVGSKAIVGAGSVVTGSYIPDGEIWAGNPAKRINDTKIRYSSKGGLMKKK